MSNSAKESLKASKDVENSVSESAVSIADIYNKLSRPLQPLEKNNIAINTLTHVKTIYDHWPSNDMGDTVDIYTDGRSVAPRFFLRHFERDWDGGWTSDDTEYWFEISEQEFEELYKYRQLR